MSNFFKDTITVYHFTNGKASRIVFKRSLFPTQQEG